MLATFLSSFVNMSLQDNVKRKVKVSKNKKKSWNKFCDVKEIEDFLEDKRFEERIGWPESEDQLFFQDNTTEIKNTGKSKNLSLKCHQNIGSFSSVPVPLNVNENKYPKRVKKVLEKKIEKKVKKVLAKKSEEKHQSKSNLNIIDPWEENEEVDEDIKDLITYRDEITEKRTPNVPSHLFQKPSLLPAVEVPHAGASYNPAFEDHQDLLRKAVDVEEKRLRGELHVKRVLTDMFPSKADAPTEKSILEEMSQGLFEDEEEEGEHQNESGFNIRNPPVIAEDRLPKSRKRKRKELKEEAKRKAVEKLKKQRLHEIYRIPSIKSEIRKEKEISKMRELKKLERKIEKMYQPKTISSYKYEPQDIEVNLSEEITGSLRTVKADGNLLEDRYKSLQRRNLIEPRIRQKMKRKYKLKKQVKRSHRGFE